jgi:hypothetical protein
MADVRTIFESTADAMASVAGEMRKYFQGSAHAGVGERVVAAWEAGIKESLELTRGLVVVGTIQSGAAKKSARPMARSDSAILEALRDSGGVITGTQKALADRLGIPASTIGGAIKRLVERGLVDAQTRRLSLLEREV